MRAIQLSLFPWRGFGFLGFDRELLVDHDEGRPALVGSRAKAEAFRKRRLPPWIQKSCRVVAVEVHEDSDDEGRPAYVVTP